MHASTFEYSYNRISAVVEYSQEWENGTGYLDYACSEVKLQPGEVAKSKDNAGRRIILVGTRFGTVVIFERYPLKTNNGDNLIVVSNLPREVEVLYRGMFTTSLSSMEFQFLLEVGNHIEISAKVFAES